MGNVVDLDEYRPHITLSCNDGHIHVIPVHLLDKIAAGEPLALLPKCAIRALLYDYVSKNCCPF
jgi:hypothetical protein